MVVAQARGPMWTGTSITESWSPPAGAGALSAGLRQDETHDWDPRAATARRERMERQEPLHRLGRRRPELEGRNRGAAWRRAPQGDRTAARCVAHQRSAPGDPD